MSGQYTKIYPADYNAIQAKVALVLGTGSGKYGYGQNVRSSSVSQNGKITVTQWNNLRNDIVAARQHQNGVTIGSRTTVDPLYTAGADLIIPNNDTKITEADRAAYMDIATSVDTNRLAVPPDSQATREDLVSVTTRDGTVDAGKWNGDILQTITVTFPDANAARYFFNTGSRFEFSSSLSGYSVGDKNTSWYTLLNNMGVIYFDYDNTTCTGTGSTSSIGWYDLTNSDQVLFEKGVNVSTTYYPNKYQILGRCNQASNTTGTAWIGTFTIKWLDDATNSGHTPYFIDEQVDGILSSYVQVRRASGANVSVPVPPASKTAIG
jgi:hypothetical protein